MSKFDEYTSKFDGVNERNSSRTWTEKLLHVLLEYIHQYILSRPTNILY